MKHSLSENHDVVEMDERAVGKQITTVPNDVSVSNISPMKEVLSYVEDDVESKYDEGDVITTTIINNDLDEHKEEEVQSAGHTNIENENNTPSMIVEQSSNILSPSKIESPPNSDTSTTTSSIFSTPTKHVTFDKPVVSSVQMLSPILEGIEEETPKHIITFDQLSVVNSERRIVNNMTESEAQYAKLLCAPITIDQQSVGYTLIDPAASRSLIRRSKIRTIKTRNPFIPIRNHYVLSSSGKEIPVTHNIRVDVRSGDHDLGDVLFYVVDDSIENDICCDIVIGRSTLAMCPYYHMDTKEGILYNPKTKATIVCKSAKSTYNSNNRLVIVPEEENESSSISNKQQKRLDKLRKVLSKQQQKIMKLNAIIGKRYDLSTSVRETLMSCLVECESQFDLPSTKKNSHLEFMMYHLHTEQNTFNTQERMLELLAYLPHTAKQSEEEKRIIHEMFSLHLPSPLTKNTQKTPSEDDVMKEVEEIDFPFTAPPPSINTKEYKTEKRNMIRKMINDNKNLNDIQKKLVIKMLFKYEARFSMKGENLQQTDIAMHEIDTGKEQPFRERLRPYSPPMQAIIDKEVRQMIEQGVLVPSRSPYASNLLLVRKPDESSPDGMKNRVCANFIKLNKQTRKDSYPLPNIQVIFDSIGKSKWFTTMDLLSGFWQVMIKPEHRHKTAVITSRGLYEYAVMAFGLCNAPATFQRLMDAVILPEYRDFVQTYIDDILTHSMTFEQHLDHLDKTLALFEKNKLMVKLSKCKFFQTYVKFLGHIISQGEIRCNPETVETIQKWQQPKPGPKAITAVRSFLGMAGWYRRFIPNFSSIAMPLYSLTKKNARFEWTTECQQAFEQLRDALTKSPVLRTADPTKDYYLHTDASDFALGATLMQKDEDGNVHPIAYASKLLNPAQRNYSVTDRECLAMAWALEHFNTYVEGHKYTIVTDHAALQYLRNTTHTKQRMHRLALRLQPYELKIEYKKGSLNHAADLLSRAPEDMISLNVTSTLNTKYKKKRKKTYKEEYEVESILNKRAVDGRANEYEYQIKWKGWEEPTWEPLEHLTKSMDTVLAYEKEQEKIKQIEKNDNKNNVDNSNNNTDDQQDSKVESSIMDSTANDVRIGCEECKQHMTSTGKHIHDYHVHNIPVPTADLNINSFEVDAAIMHAAQRNDPEFQFIFDSRLGRDISYEDITPKEKRILLSHEFVIGDNDLLYCIDIPGSRAKSRLRTRLRLCIPQTMRRRIMSTIHDSKTAHHPSEIPMYDTLREIVWWPSMLSEISTFVRRCSECLKTKKMKVKVPIQPVSVPTRPWGEVSVDLQGPFPITDRGNRYILVAIDVLTRYAEAIPLPDIETKTVCEAIITYVILRHGWFDTVRSDRGQQFVSILAANIYKQMGIKQITTTAWHPQSNGIVERFNGTLKRTLKLWVNETQNDWDIYIPYAMFAYHTSFHSTMQETPFYMTYGRDPSTILTKTLGIRPEQAKDTEHYATELAQRLYDVHTRVIEIYKSVNEKRLEEGANDVPTFEIGQQIYLYYPGVKTRRKGDDNERKTLTAKLIKRWKGPYNVMKKLSNTTYTIEKDGKLQNVHVERMRDAVNHKQTTIEDYDYDLTLADAELESLKTTQEMLITRENSLREEKSKLEAEREIEREEREEIALNTQVMCVSVSAHSHRSYAMS